MVYASSDEEFSFHAFLVVQTTSFRRLMLLELWSLLPFRRYLFLAFILNIATSIQLATHNDHFFTKGEFAKEPTSAVLSSHLPPCGSAPGRGLNKFLYGSEPSNAGDGSLHFNTQETNLMQATRVPIYAGLQRRTLQTRTQISRVTCSDSQRQILTEVLAQVANISQWAHQASTMEWLFHPEHGEDRDNFFAIFRTLDTNKLRKVANYYAGVHFETARINSGAIIISCHSEDPICLSQPNGILKVMPESNLIVVVDCAFHYIAAILMSLPVREILDTAQDR